MVECAAEKELPREIGVLAMAIPGCDLKESPINNAYHSDDELWSAINNLFSTRARFTTSYKFCFFKSILDNIYNVNENLE